MKLTKKAQFNLNNMEKSCPMSYSEALSLIDGDDLVSYLINQYGLFELFEMIASVVEGGRPAVVKTLEEWN